MAYITLPGVNNIYFSRLRYASVALARNVAQIQIEILALIKHYNYFFIDFYVRFKMTKFEYLYPGLYIYQYISHAGMQLRADAIECSSQD